MREDELVCSAVGPQSTEREFTTTASLLAATEARIRADEREAVLLVVAQELYDLADCSHTNAGPAWTALCDFADALRERATP